MIILWENRHTILRCFTICLFAFHCKPVGQRYVVSILALQLLNKSFFKPSMPFSINKFSIPIFSIINATLTMKIFQKGFFPKILAVVWVKVIKSILTCGFSKFHAMKLWAYSIVECRVVSSVSPEFFKTR